MQYQTYTYVTKCVTLVGQKSVTPIFNYKIIILTYFIRRTQSDRSESSLLLAFLRFCILQLVRKERYNWSVL